MKVFKGVLFIGCCVRWPLFPLLIGLHSVAGDKDGRKNSVAMGIGGGEAMCQHTLSLFLSPSPSLRRSYTRSLPHWLPPFAVSEGWGFTGGPLPSRPTQGSQNSDATSIISRPFQIEPKLEEGMRALAPPTPSLFLSFSLFLASFRSYFMACLVCVPVHSGNSSSSKEFNASDLFYSNWIEKKSWLQKTTKV